MPSKHDARDCIADILENVERVHSYVAGMSFEAFERDRRTRDAVERCLERICEAGVRLGEAANELMPGQPWHRIRGFGNQLRHAYDGLDLGVIWSTIHIDLPALAADARDAVQRLGRGRGRAEL